MRLPAIALAIAVPALIGAGSPTESPAPLLDDQLNAARAEQVVAERAARRLQAIVAKARTAAERLALERAAAAQAIDAAEAQITATEAELALSSARLAAFRRQLDAVQQPVSALLAGLVTIGQRPPILALADRGGVDELVRTRILLESTMPTVRRRSSALAKRIAVGQKMEAAASDSRSTLLAGRRDLVVRQSRFAALERRAVEATLAAGGEALSAGDRVIAGREALDVLSADGRRSATNLALELIAAGPALARPGAPIERSATSAPFDYDLPTDAQVTRGLAEIDRGGVRSRGLAMATLRGSRLIVPANGIVRFSGPFRDYDGIVIIDHGKGWTSLIVNVASPLEVGSRVKQGKSLGRALGPIEVELSHYGRRLSPAIIAGSSKPLSMSHKGR
ncbi:MAG: peptidoglycan DD-metalloendopeptidase family protein [Sphingomicrobium sp.]